MFSSEYNNNITSVIAVVASRSDTLPGISIQHINSDYVKYYSNYCIKQEADNRIKTLWHDTYNMKLQTHYLTRYYISLHMGPRKRLAASKIILFLIQESEYSHSGLEQSPFLLLIKRLMVFLQPWTSSPSHILFFKAVMRSDIAQLSLTLRGLVSTQMFIKKR